LPRRTAKREECLIFPALEQDQNPRTRRLAREKGMLFHAYEKPWTQIALETEASSPFRASEVRLQ
jgi:hypothetical protein